MTKEWEKSVEDKLRKDPKAFKVIADMIGDLCSPPIDRQEVLENIAETLDILELGIIARDKGKAFEAVTTLLMQVLHSFKNDNRALVTTFPLLEQFKDSIVAGDFAEALSYCQAFRAMFRS